MIIQRSHKTTIELLMTAYAELLQRIEKATETVKETKETQTTLDHRVSTLVDSWFEGKGTINKHITF